MKLIFIVNVDWYFKLHWLERACYFCSLGYEVHVATKYTDSNIKDKFERLGFYCHDIEFKRSSLNVFSELLTTFKIKSILNEVKPDIIHSITIKPNIYAGLARLIFFSYIPIVYSVTGLGAVYSSGRLKFRIIRSVVSCLYRIVSSHNSRFIFENSDDLLTYVNLEIIKNNGVVIKGAGIDLEKFAPSSPSCERNVLFAARLLKDKGLYELVEAKILLKNKGINFSLNVAGIIDADVISAIPMSQILKWESQGYINWLGSVDNMPELIAKNDIVCLPTTYGEGVPRILIEAACCQRAIITTDVAGCRDIVRHRINGLLVEPGSVRSLANSLREMLQDEDMVHKFGINGRLIVKDEYDQAIVFQRTNEVYLSLVGV